MHWHDGWGMYPGMWVFWCVIVIVVVLLVIWLLRSGGGPGGGRHSDAEEELKRRYARGEISREEYEQKLDDLRR